jgi:hypothetical protein
VGQISGEYATQGGRLVKYLEKVNCLQSNFRSITIKKIPRKENVQADALARAGSATEQEIIKMKRQVLVQPSLTIAGVFDLMQLTQEKEPEPEWASDVIKYLKDRKLPGDKMYSHKVRVQSARYMIVDGVLYRRGYSHPLLKCLFGY